MSANQPNSPPAALNPTVEAQLDNDYVDVQDSPPLSGQTSGDTIFGVNPSIDHNPERSSNRSAGPSTLPISTLQAFSAGTNRVNFQADATIPLQARTMAKDADDPTTPPSTSSRRLGGRESTTFTTLSRLFAGHADISPGVSRQPSELLQVGQASRRPSGSTLGSEKWGLPDHLYTQGLLAGRHSDITVNAFSQQYRLHRLILDQAPFFSTALSEPWLKAGAKELTIHPEDMDPSITQSAFELALKRLYGRCDLAQEEVDPVGLFATGCWLEMQDLIDSAIESTFRQMTPETLSPLIKLVTSNYYGRSGDKILASAKSMLCRDGWKMPLRLWDGIPGDIVREIVGGDGFFVDGEWDRWVLAKRILDRRLRAHAIKAGLIEPGSRRKVMQAPNAYNLMAVRFDSVYRKDGRGLGYGYSEELNKWINCYTQPDVEPLLVLLDEGIHYIHLDFEQLQFIRKTRDCFGLPVMAERVLSNALWQQMELRQRIMNSHENELEIGLSIQCADDPTVETSRDTTMSISTPSDPKKAKACTPASGTGTPAEYFQSGSWERNGKPRKFWIPSSDCNIVMGGNADPIIATSHNTTIQRHAGRMGNALHPEDIQWAADFSAAVSAMSHPRPPIGDGLSPPTGEPVTVSYTHFPPFRFAAEFPNPRFLKEKKRVYSRTVFYAGSLWNIYIQKVASSRSKQLGVYLHRAKERETEEAIAGAAGLPQGNVGQRISAVERGTSLRDERRERHRHRRRTTISDGADADDADSSGSAGDHDSTLVGGLSTESDSRAHTMRNLLARSHHKTSQTSAEPTLTTDTDHPRAHDGDSASSDSAASSEDESDAETELLAMTSKKFQVPALPPYVDARPTIKTYFKIYSPSRGGRMLSVYESAPDKFNFSQSWGWKSSNLMLDDGIGGEEDEAQDDGLEALATGEKDGGASAGRRTMKGRGDGKLRFMVVIGNI